jgi:hypothetical protein
MPRFGVCRPRYSAWGRRNIPRPSRSPQRIAAGQTPSLSPVRGSREPGRYAMTDIFDPFSARTPKLSSRAAGRDVVPRKTVMAARSACMVNVTPGLLLESIMEPGVAGRSFGLLRYDLLLQIDPSVTDPSAGYILRRTTSYHKLPLRPSSRRILAATAPVRRVSAWEKPCYQTVLPPRARQIRPCASALTSHAPSSWPRPPTPEQRRGTVENGSEGCKDRPRRGGSRCASLRNRSPARHHEDRA